MRNESKLLSAVAAILAITAGAAALGQDMDGKADIAGSKYFVKNVSGVALRCAWRINNGAWKPEFNFAVNREFTRTAGSASETVGFACREPMVQGSNRLQPGQRYVIRKRDGQIKLVRLAL